MPTRAQLRDMEARALATRVTRSDVAETPPVGEASIGTRADARRRARAITRPVALSREEEYSAIQADLNRLLITAGSLLALMLITLVIFER